MKTNSLKYELYSKLKIFINLYVALFFIFIGTSIISFYFYIGYRNIQSTVITLKIYANTIENNVSDIVNYANILIKQQNYNEKKFIYVINNYFKHYKKDYSFTGIGYASINKEYNTYSFIDLSKKSRIQNLNNIYKKDNGYKNTSWFKDFKDIKSTTYISPQVSRTGEKGKLLLTVIAPIKKASHNIGLLIIDINISRKLSNFIHKYDPEISNNLKLYLVSNPYFSHTNYQIFNISRSNNKITQTHDKQITKLLVNKASYEVNSNSIFYKKTFLNNAMTIILALNWNIILFIIASYTLLTFIIFLLINNFFLNKISKTTAEISDTISLLSNNIFNILKNNETAISNRGIVRDKLITETMYLYKSYRKIRFLLNDVKKLSFYDGEMNLAKKLQQRIIKTKDNVYFKNNFYKVNIDIASKAADKRSGDLYLTYIKNNKIYILIGDSTGKNITATIHALFCLFAIEKIIDKYTNFDDIAYKINEYICNQDLEGMFLSSIILEIDLDKQIIRYINAGHELPIINKQENLYILKQDDYDIVFGAIPKYIYQIRNINFNELLNGSIYIYTDGITEANIVNNQMLGIDSFIEILKYNDDVGKIIDNINNQELNGIHDDKTLIKISLNSL
ncbi:hypothetical protein CDV26_07795 [Francisella halioticida]|uniref:PPM-type phosphatase domain-containing protein n=1 Tax=Francisella halioticida TaxID=549298 RepID=A0ABM6M045_9GAMM|nr:SpoIIE family protein phosphatase [Francisella halioticida]ASG68303.1 hypothetical protein CDV26_07795 [Francisella halioticida]